jgi:hypothetical protein
LELGVNIPSGPEGRKYRVRQKDLPHFKRQLQTNKERYGKNTLICEQQI